MSNEYYYRFGLTSNMVPKEYNSHYMRGAFERNGSINKRNIFNDVLEISIATTDNYFSECLEYILPNIHKNATFVNNFCYIFQHDAFDFLSHIYDHSDARYRNNEMYNTYVDWATLGQNAIPYVKFFKTTDEAVIPSKERATDVGMDLTIIKKVKDLGKRTALYDTCIKVSPQFGYYTKIVPRSSLTKSGYILTNSTGIIDGSYKGNLLICLTKVDDSMPDLTLPYKCCQLILDRSIHYTSDIVNTEEALGTSTRNDGGFGSTNNV